MIFITWAAGGQTRPYKAPVSLKRGEREFAYYIRKGSLTVRAGQQNETELMSLAATVPFDDRLNQQAIVEDLDLGLMRSYLKQVKSDLFRECGPIFHTDEDRTFLLVEFPIHPVFAGALKTIPEVTMEVTPEVTMEVKRLLNTMTGEHPRRELQEMLGLKNGDHFRKAYLSSAIEAGLVEMTLPDKPKSRFQKYRLTETGRALQKLKAETGVDQ